MAKSKEVKWEILMLHVRENEALQWPKKQK